MNLDKLKRLSENMNNTDPEKVIKSLVGKKVPLSGSMKVKLLKYTEGTFEFDYDEITKEQQNYFINWLEKFIYSELNQALLNPKYF